MNEDLRPKRGCFLTGVIVLIIVGSIFSIAQSGFRLSTGSYEILPGLVFKQSTLVIGLITSIINIIAMVLILRWKKIGAYIYGVLSLVSFAITLFTSEELSALIIVSAIIGLIISLLIAYSSYKVIVKRESFDMQA